MRYVAFILSIIIFSLSTLPCTDGQDHTANVWMFPIDESLDPIRKTFSAFHEDGAPSQSHDGTKIAFESHLGQDEEEPSEIWIIE